MGNTKTKEPEIKYRFEESRHIHTFGGQPLIGTTTLIHNVLPPNLTWWASGMALKGFGWENPKFTKKEDRVASVEAWFEVNKDKLSDPILFEEHLQLCYRAHDDNKKNAAEGGTSIHNEIEIAVKEAIKNNFGYLREEKYDHEAVERFAEWGRGKKFIHSEAHVFSALLWLGGVVDLVYEDDGKIYIGDIKTSKSIYPQHFIQEGLYDLQQGENGFFDSDGNKIGDSLDIAGYTVINIPRINAELNVKTYRGVDKLRSLGIALVDAYKTLKTLEDIC